MEQRKLNIGLKQNPNKANLHILVGQAGAGKTTILQNILENTSNTPIVLWNRHQPTKYYPEDFSKDIERFVSNVLSIDFKFDYFLPENFYYEDYCMVKIGQYEYIVNGKHIERYGSPEPLQYVVNLITVIYRMLYEEYTSGTQWLVDSELSHIPNQQFTFLIDDTENYINTRAKQTLLLQLQSTFPNGNIFCTAYNACVSEGIKDAWIYDIQKGETINPISTNQKQ